MKESDFPSLEAYNACFWEWLEYTVMARGGQIIEDVQGEWERLTPELLYAVLAIRDREILLEYLAHLESEKRLEEHRNNQRQWWPS